MYGLALVAMLVWHVAAVPQLLTKAGLTEDTLKKKPRGTRLDLATVPLPVPLGAAQPAISVASLGPQWSSVDPATAGATAGKVGTWLCGVFTAAGGALHNARRNKQQQPRRRRQRQHNAVAQADHAVVEAGDYSEALALPEQQSALQAFPVEQFQQQPFPQLQQQPQVFMPMQQMPQAQSMQQPQQQGGQQGMFVMTTGMPQPMEAFGQVWVPVGWAAPAVDAQQATWGEGSSSMDAPQNWASTEDSCCATPEDSPRGSVATSFASAVSGTPMGGVATHLAVTSFGMAPHGPAVWQQEVMPAPGTWAESRTRSASTAASSAAPSPPPTPHGGALTKAKCTAKEAEGLVAQMKKGSDAQKKQAIEQVTRMAWPLALTRHGCRVVQAAFDAAGAPGRLALADSLRGRVMEAWRSPHANHVLQKCVAVLPPDRVLFVVSELSGSVRDAARHAFGCRVLERLLEHCPHQQTKGLASEVLDDVVELARHPYGNYVVQHLLEHGLPEQRRAVARALAPEVRRLARHKIASNVVEKALTYCAEEERHALKEAMIGSPEELASLEHSNYGSFVVKEMRRR